MARVTRSKRANGTGTVYIKSGGYYGRWVTAAGGRTNRRLGPVRLPGTSIGLTRAQAERRLRDLIDSVQVTTNPLRTVAATGCALIEELEAKGRSRSHIESVECHLRVHLVPFFAERALDRIDEDQVKRLVARLRRRGLAPKTIRNILSTLHSVFELARRRRWVVANPCSLVDLPAAARSADIRFLSFDELDAVLARGIPDDDRGAIERPLYLMAAMTGLRQGELLGLRWRDLDLIALKVRVRQAYVRGEFKSPKSVRGSRGVPLAALLLAELAQLRDGSPFDTDDDLVFADPETGRPLRREAVRTRFRKACDRAGVRVVRFHDLRHTFGTRLAASGEVSLRTLQEWMGHADVKTTLIYADYQPAEHEAELIGRAFTART
jgi:integrase